MDESELKAIREARLQQLKGQQKQAAPKDKPEGLPAEMLAQLLTQDARERLNRVRMVKPERAAQAEKLLVTMAQTGQLHSKLDDKGLVGLLDQLMQHDTPSSRLRFDRKDSEFEDAFSTSTPAKKEDSDDDFFD